MWILQKIYRKHVDEYDFTCKKCEGSYNYHLSIQKTNPHDFVKEDKKKLLPYERGPYWEGGFPLIN